MVSTLSSERGSGSSPGQGRCVVFSGNTLYISQCLSPPMPGVEMGAGELSGSGSNIPSYFMLRKPGQVTAVWARFSLLFLFILRYNYVA